MSDTYDTPKRKTLAELIQNGVGQLVTRLLIMAMPFVFAGSIWAGKAIIELARDQIIAAINQQGERLDKVVVVVENQGQRINVLESASAGQGAKLDGLRDRIDDERTRR